MATAATPYIERINRETDATETRKLAKFMAVDLPCPGETAFFLATTDPILARTLISAYEGPNGWRISAPPGSIGTWAVVELRSAGLIEAAGTKPTPDSIAKGKGFHLSAFGLKVRRHLKRLSNL